METTSIIATIQILVSLRMSGVTDSPRGEVDCETVTRPKASAPVPTRTCVGCRGKGARSELLRVAMVGDELVPDLPARLPGRGAWVHLEQDCLALAVRRRALPRALRVPGPLDVTAVEEQIEVLTTVHLGSGSKKP